MRVAHLLGAAKPITPRPPEVPLPLQPPARPPPQTYGPLLLPPARHGGPPVRKTRTGPPRVVQGMAVTTRTGPNLRTLITTTRLTLPSGRLAATRTLNTGQATAPKPPTPPLARRALAAGGLHTQTTSAGRRTSPRGRPPPPEAVPLPALRALAAAQPPQGVVRAPALPRPPLRVPLATPQVGKEARAPAAAGAAGPTAEGAGPVRHGPTTPQPASEAVALVILGGVAAT